MTTLDFDTMANEAVDLLQRYIRLDTTNPPGNEELACDWLARLLAAEGIDSQKLVSAPGRANLIARLEGSDRDAKPLVLLHHSDVVPVEAEHWQVEPYSGVIRDGYVWGRGALDMKGMGTLEIVAFLTLRRLGVRLRRPVELMVVADEEAGSDYGAEWLDQQHPELLDADFVINEGGYGSEAYLGVERPSFGLSMAEKSPLWLTLKSVGRPGHGSAPHDDNVVDRMVRAMQRIQDWRRPTLLTDPVASSLRAAYAEGYLDADPDKTPPEEIGGRYRVIGNLMTNTISATGLGGGVKHNVIPARASATIDCRLVPAYDPARFIEELRTVIDDPKVEVETVFAAESPVTQDGTELTDAIRSVCGEVMPEAAVLPRVSAGFTDSRTFRRRGVPAYGFVPMLLGPGEQGGMHGNDERISLQNLRLGVEVLYRVVERVCGG
jgi:acetylornithine deacetylase/succinyl-diaminopimelate desuccinylase-like protein